MSDTDSMANPSLLVGIDSDLARIVVTMLAVAPGIEFSIAYRVHADGDVLEKIVSIPSRAVGPQKDVA